MNNLSLTTEEKLGYSTLKAILAGRANTEEGKAICENLKPYSQPKKADRALDQTIECRDLLLNDESFSLAYTVSVKTLLEHASLAGNWLNKADLFRLSKWLRMVRDLLNYFKSRREKYPFLWKLLESLVWKKELLQLLEKLIDERGNIRDNASPALQSIRKNHFKTAADLRKQLHSILRNAVSQGWSEASEITIRNDRYVIPFKADFKGKLKGFVHDVSQSGQTIYLEPSATLELNNRIRQLLAEEQNEIMRLLLATTAAIREDLPALKDFAKVVTQIDFIRAKARLAIDIDGEKPQFKPDSGIFRLVNARHPLLLLKPGMGKDNVVPLSISMDKGQRILLVSGPNAGGKSVTLKTVGLLQVMLQAGIPIPVDPSSGFCWFDSIFIDIGDEQSIQSDLSTYTSHLQNMKVMVEALDERSLFLMDEFGSGTDPRLGGAIAEAFLEYFVASGAYGVITTHYGNLKNYADKTPGIVNAAMQFDPENLSPTYKIESGLPGRSYAFEIARNVGIGEEWLERAREKLDGGEVYGEDLLLRLEAQKAELERVLNENKIQNAQLKELLTRNQAHSRKLKIEETEILRKAHKHAQGMINSANSKIERTIREIRESQAEKEKTKELRKELAEMLPNPPPQVKEEKEVEPEPERLPGAKISEGDWVLLKDSNSFGQVLDIQGKRAVVALGEMRVTVKLRQLVKIRRPAGGGIIRKKQGGLGIARKANVSLELKVKGFRVEQALPVVDRFIDDALLAGLKEVRILHGKGTGALRQAIREHLQIVPEVIRMDDAAIEAGGSGWTVCTLSV